MSSTFQDLLRPASPALGEDELLERVLDPAQWEGKLAPLRSDDGDIVEGDLEGNDLEGGDLEGDDLEGRASAADVDHAKQAEPEREPLADVEQLVDRVERDGWARLDGALSEKRVQSVLDGVREVSRLGLPAVFAYLFPEVWSALAAPALRSPVQALLPGAKQLPRSWITQVPPVEGARGWEPHLDASREPRRMDDGRFERLTLWIALTESTIDNGCIHLIPASRVRGPFTDLFEQEQLPTARALALLHAAQAVPCSAGTALWWRTDVLHWGGWASGEGLTRRVGVALHFLHGKARTPARERPTRELFDPPPSHSGRAAFVARQVLAYEGYERQLPNLHQISGLARRILEQA